jgi:DNA-binding NtrC family response regulator
MADAILIVEDDPIQRHMLALTLKREASYTVIEAENGKDAITLLQQPLYQQKIRAIILDLEMPIMNGMETLELLSQTYPDVPVIMLTGHNEPERIVAAMKLGAVDFIAKPYEPKRVLITLENAIKLNLLSRELNRVQKKQDNQFRFSDIIGFDSGLASTIQIARKAAQSHIPVLLMGETGVGKEVLARAIHGESARAGQAFVALNCGALPAHLVESTLFGHEKGAFTGATHKTFGKFREAEGGTLFLDEIGELPKDIQVKLLRVLQQKEIEPVGSDKSVPVNVRIISATNRNLQQDVADNLFREDLYFRLSVLPILIPPLRERRQDIPSLARYFIEKYCVQYQKKIKILSDQALTQLIKKSWVGNVRELENCLHREVVLKDQILLEELEVDKGSGSSALMLNSHSIHTSYFDASGLNLKPLDDVEKEAIEHALQFYDYDIISAAKALGVAKSTLYRKIDQYKIKRK